jgi:copper chaperone
MSKQSKKLILITVIVEFDPSLINKEEIKDRLEKSGYKFVRVASAR